MEIFGFSERQMLGGVLIFVRVLGIFTAAPVFGHAHLPTQLKVGLALMMTVVLINVVPPPPPGLADNLLLLGGAAVKEAVVGLVIGYVAMLVFLAIQLAGEAVDIQIGFGLASMADPLLGHHTSLVGQFQFMIATLLFLAVNGHHLLLSALAQSFELAPLGEFTFQAVLAGRVLQTVADLFLLGLRIGGPVMLAVFLTDLALGLLGRAVPQMNLLVVGFPVKVTVGLLALMASVPFFLLNCRGLFNDMYRDLLLILRAM